MSQGHSEKFSFGLGASQDLQFGVELGVPLMIEEYPLVVLSIICFICVQIFLKL